MSSQQKRWVCGRGVLALKSCEPLRKPRGKSEGAKSEGTTFKNSNQCLPSLDFVY